MRRSLPIVVAAVAAALIVAAPAATGVQAPAASSATVVIRMTDGLQFQPARVTVKRGTRVTWKNVGSVAHTITSIRANATNKAYARVPAGAMAWDSGFVGGGRSYSRVLRTPGVYRYFCIPHEGAKMIGTIVVT